MLTINPYLHFDGTTEEAFNFYKSVFGGEFIVLQRFKDVPKEAGQFPAHEQEKIMHVALPIGRGNVLMGSDSPESMGTVKAGNNLSLSINTQSEQETERVFNALSVGGTIEMPLAKTFWNAYFGMFTDKFGIRWMVNYSYTQ